MRKAGFHWRAVVVVALGIGGLMVVAGAVTGHPVEAARHWAQLRSSTIAREEVASTRIGRFIYVVGGFTRRIPSGVLPTTGIAERYDTRTNRWRRIAPLPVPVNHAAAVTYAGSLYVYGGWPQQVEYNAVGNLSRYDADHDRWVSLPASPAPRAAAAAAVIGDRLYVAGGADNSGSLNSLEIYDFQTQRWSAGPSFTGPARNHTRGVASGHYFYVLGGRRGKQILADPSPAVSYADVDRYDPRTRRWRRMQPMPTARSGFAAVALADRRIAVYGGESWPNDVPGSGVIGSAQIFDPRTGRWGRLPAMRTPRHAPGGAAVGDRVYAIEGSTLARANSPTRTNEVLDVPGRRR